VTAQTYDLPIAQGEDLQLYIVWRDKAGALVDLTGARVLFQVRDAVDSADTLLDFDSDNLRDGQTIGPLNTSGVIDANVSGDITALLDFTLGKWDLFVILAGGQDKKLLKGKSSLERAVTRWR